MRKCGILLCMALVLGLVGFAEAVDDALSRPYKVTLGDWLAYRLSEIIRTNPLFSMTAVDHDEPSFFIPTLVSYDREREIIVVEVYGNRNSVTEAKKSLLEWWSLVENRHIPDAEKNYGIKLHKADYTIVYFYPDRVKHELKEMIRMEDGKLLLPQK